MDKLVVDGEESSLAKVCRDGNGCVSRNSGIDLEKVPQDTLCLIFST